MFNYVKDLLKTRRAFPDMEIPEYFLLIVSFVAGTAVVTLLMFLAEFAGTVLVASGLKQPQTYTWGDAAAAGGMVILFAGLVWLWVPPVVRRINAGAAKARVAAEGEGQKQNKS